MKFNYHVSVDFINPKYGPRWRSKIAGATGKSYKEALRKLSTQMRELKKEGYIK